jgi:hypothetical protein
VDQSSLVDPVHLAILEIHYLEDLEIPGFQLYLGPLEFPDFLAIHCPVHLDFLVRLADLDCLVHLVLLEIHCPVHLDFLVNQLDLDCLAHLVLLAIHYLERLGSLDCPVGLDSLVPQSRLESHSLDQADLVDRALLGIPVLHQVAPVNRGSRENQANRLSPDTQCDHADLVLPLDQAYKKLYLDYNLGPF